MAVDDKSPSVSFKELGTTGLNQMGGSIDEEHIINALKWPRCIKVYQEMETDPLIAGALFTIKQFIRSAKWNVEEYQGTDKPADAGEAAKFVESCLDDMNKPWSEALTDILSFLVYGFSIHEIVYKKRQGRSSDERYNSKHNDGKIGWRAFPIRSQDTIEEWKMTDRGGLEAVRQQDVYNGIDVWIPKDRFLLFRTTAYKDNPRGLSILRSAYRGYYFRKNIEMFEGYGIERDLAGIPIFRVPGEILDADADENQKAIRSYMERMGAALKRNEQAFVMLPSETQGDTGNGDKYYDMELLSSSGSRQVQTGPVIERYDRRILQSMSAEVINIGSASVGSYSLSTTKAGMFETAITSYLDTIKDQINQKAIPMLMELNGFDSESCPQISHNGVESVDLEQMGKFVKATTDAGALTPDASVEEELREMAGFKPFSDSAQNDLMARARKRQESEETSSGQMDASDKGFDFSNEI